MRRGLLRAPRPWLLPGLLCAALACSAAAQPAAAPRGAASGIAFRSEGELGAGLGRAVGALVLVLGLGLGAVHLLRRRMRAAGPGPLRRVRVVERQRASPRTTLLLVEFDGRTVLVGEHGGALVVLARGAGAPQSPPAEEAAA